MYIRGKVGISALRSHYGGNQRHGTCPNHIRKSAGKVIRYCIKQMEDAQLVGKLQIETDNGSQVIGKSLTKKGITDMDRIASQITKKKKAEKK